MGTVNLTQEGERGIAEGIYHLTEYDPDPSHPLFNGQMAAGDHAVTAIFNGKDQNFIVDDPPAKTITVTQEEALVDYIGVNIIGEANVDVDEVPVELKATITDTTIFSEVIFVMPG